MWKSVSKSSFFASILATVTNKGIHLTSKTPSSSIKGKILSEHPESVVLVDGVRTPFLVSGTTYANLHSYELARHSLLSLLRKTNVDKEIIDYIVYSNAIQDPNKPNIGRTAAFAAGFSNKIPAHTLSMACISSNQAITTGIGLIATGTYKAIIAGGVEFMSDFNIRHSNKTGSLMLRATIARTRIQKLKMFASLRPDFFIPVVHGITEFITSESMGHSSDRLAASFNVSRQEQDEFSLRSHILAHQAQNNGYLTDLIPFKVRDVAETVDKDNGIRVSTLEAITKFKPAINKLHGTTTEGNATYLTDGASACLIMTESKAEELGLKPKAYLRGFTYVSQDPFDQLLLGPAYGIPKILKETGLTLNDIDCFEIHEAFAAQICSNLKALDSTYFSQKYLGLSDKFGAPDLNKLNNWGGSLAFGHPLAATGVRLCMHAANRMVREDGKLSLVSACAADGQGVAMILERHPLASAD